MARFRLLAGPVPLHHQVYLDLRAAIEAGEWRPGDRLPPERELAERYGCSLITVRRALGDLARERRLERTPRPGHVRHPPADRPRPRGLDVVHRGGPAPGPRPGDPRRHRADRRRRRRRRRGPGDRDRRLAWSTSSGSGWPTASRCCSSRSSCPRRRFPGPARRRPRARLAVRAARRALRHPRRPGPGVARAHRPPAARGPAARRRAPQAGAAHRRPGLRPPGRPVEFARSFVRGDRTRYYVERVVVRSSPRSDDIDAGAVGAATAAVRRQT